MITSRCLWFPSTFSMSWLELDLEISVFPVSIAVHTKQFLEEIQFLSLNLMPWKLFQEITGACLQSDCDINEKCIPKPFNQFTCILSGLNCASISFNGLFAMYIYQCTIKCNKTISLNFNHMPN